jgi:hypothetical protein
LQEFDPSTGKLATMSASIYASALSLIGHECYHVIATSLESLRQLDKPIGPLAVSVFLRPCLYPLDEHATPQATIAFHSTSTDEIATCLIVFFNGKHECASKFAQIVTKRPKDTHTVVAVSLALPGKMDSERKLERLGENSSVSVFTMVDGVPKTVVSKERLSTSGGGVKLWLSDFVKERESLPDEFVRPTNSEYVFSFLFSRTTSPRFTQPPLTLLS